MSLEDFLLENERYTYLSKGNFGLVFQGSIKSHGNSIIKVQQIENDENVNYYARESIANLLVSNNRLNEGPSPFAETFGFVVSNEHLPDNFIYTKNKDNNWLTTNAKKLYVFQEIAGEQTLAEYLISLGETPMDKRTIRSILFQMLWGIYVAQSRFGLVHRDIKPENVMISKVTKDEKLTFGIPNGAENNAFDYIEITLQKGDFKIKMIDLGFACINLEKYKDLLQYDMTSCTEGDGTPVYKHTNEDDGVSIDLWAVGVTATALASQGRLRIAKTLYTFKTIQGPPAWFGKKKAVPTDKDAESNTNYMLNALSTSVMPENPFQDLRRAIQDAMDDYGLLLVQDLLQPDTLKRLQFGLPDEGEWGANSALFHPYFVLDGKYWLGSQTNIPVQIKALEIHAKPLPFRNPADIRKQVQIINQVIAENKEQLDRIAFEKKPEAVSPSVDTPEVPAAAVTRKKATKKAASSEETSADAKKVKEMILTILRAMSYNAGNVPQDLTSDEEVKILAEQMSDFAHLFYNLDKDLQTKVLSNYKKGGEWIGKIEDYLQTNGEQPVPTVVLFDPVENKAQLLFKKNSKHYYKDLETVYAPQSFVINVGEPRFKDPDVFGYSIVIHIMYVTYLTLSKSQIPTMYQLGTETESLESILSTNGDTNMRKIGNALGKFIWDQLQSVGEPEETSISNLSTENEILNGITTILSFLRLRKREIVPIDTWETKERMISVANVMSKFAQTFIALSQEKKEKVLGFYKDYDIVLKRITFNDVPKSSLHWRKDNKFLNVLKKSDKLKNVPYGASNSFHIESDMKMTPEMIYDLSCLCHFMLTTYLAINNKIADANFMLNNKNATQSVLTYPNSREDMQNYAQLLGVLTFKKVNSLQTNPVETKIQDAIFVANLLDSQWDKVTQDDNIFETIRQLRVHPGMMSYTDDISKISQQVTYIGSTDMEQRLFFDQLEQVTSAILEY